MSAPASACWTRRARSWPRLRLSRLSPRPGGDRRARCCAGEDVLAVMPTGSGKSLCYPIAGAGRGGADAGRLAADRADARSGRATARTRRRGRGAEFGDRRGRAAARRARPARAARCACSMSRPSGCCATTRSTMLKEADDRSARDRRSPLRLAMGPRFPARISAPARGRRGARRRADDRGDRDRRRADARRHRRAAVLAAAARLRALVRPAEPVSGDAPKGQCDAPARRAARRASRRERHHLLRLAPPHRGAGARNSQRRGRRALPYHAGLDHADALAQPGRLSAGGRRRRCARPSPSAWASTSPTCASSFTPTCPPRSRPITRRSAAPGATACRPTRFTLYGAGDIELRRRQIAESDAPDERKRIETGKLDDLVALCETRALPPPGAARHVRRGGGAVRPLRRLQGRGAADRRQRSRRKRRCRRCCAPRGASSSAISPISWPARRPRR